MNINLEDGVIAGIREWFNDRFNEGHAKWAVIAVAGILVIVAVLAAYGQIAGGPDPEDVMGKGRPMLVICTECGHAGKQTVGWQESFPVKCPKCRKKTAVLAQRCGRCGTVFAHPQKPVYHCPKCKAKFEYFQP